MLLSKMPEWQQTFLILRNVHGVLFIIAGRRDDQDEEEE